MKPSCAVTKLTLACGRRPLRPVQVRRAGQAARELADQSVVALPVGAHRVAVLVVPLGPAGREVADLVAAGAEVPGLGDQLDVGQHRILADDVEERAEPVDVVQLAGERRREVEAEAVDVHLGHPVAQRIHHQLQHARMLHVERVAAAGEVHVVARRPPDSAGSRRHCRCRGSTASGPAGCPRRCGCRRRRGSPRVRPSAATSPSS